MKKYAIFAIAMLAFSATAQAVEYMNTDQAQAVFNNKTFDGVYVPKNSKFKAFEAPNGDHNVLRPNGDRDKGRKWEINGKGQHCTTHPKKKSKMRCASVKDMGNGVIHKFDDKGKNTHILTNFRDGNQL
ncbi:MAG: hypothetical protein ACTSV1_10180 [Alphaproteobacteria bacterium]